MFEMKRIIKLCSDPAVSYAADELKKYLRMMMPEAGDVEITSEDDGKTAFRLGIMSDLGLPLDDVSDPAFDDVIYIKTDTRGGLIAGSNPRSVLIAVYEYLRRNGCRWLLPGIEGEYIPMQDIVAVEYRHKAASRIRGNCIEGSLTPRILNDYIDFLPKVGLNTFMVQFKNPYEFYIRHYARGSRGQSFRPEKLTKDKTLMWIRMAEAEMSKRGIMLHAVGHGWTVDPFGIDSSDAWEVKDDSIVPEDMRKYLAQVNGKREIWGGRVLNTQICMSNPTARSMVAEHIAEYARTHSNVEYLHVWLADATNNHCECAECVKRSPSDWYVILLNEIDAKLTERGLSTRIVFIAYTDTMWAPVLEKFKNTDRFTLMIAPISRDYTKTIDPDVEAKTCPFVLNKNRYSKNLGDFLLYYKDWKKVADCTSFVFEYHFWRQLGFDVSGLKLSRRIYEDAKVYRENGFDGVVECGTQRGFYPNGLAHYTHARALFDEKISFDEIVNDYFTHAYGEAAGEVREYLTEIESVIPFEWLSHGTTDGLISPEQAKATAGASAVTKKGRDLAAKYYGAPERLTAISMKLIGVHADMVEFLAQLLCQKAQGHDEEALRLARIWGERMYAVESSIHPYVDQVQAHGTLNALMNGAIAAEKAKGLRD